MVATNQAVTTRGLAPAVMDTTMADAPGAIMVPGADAPVRMIDSDQVRLLGMTLSGKFDQYRKDRRMQETRWMRNLRQYLGFYDPEVAAMLQRDRSQAYPKLTRVKCISILSRIMDLMFPSDDRNWTLDARPSADMDFADVTKALQERQQKDAAANNGQPPQVTKDYITSVVRELAEQRAADAMTLIDDQLQELGGDQSYDYIQLNCEASASAIMYGVGLLRGPFVREVNWSTWGWDETQKQPVVEKHVHYMPQFEFLRVWDFYPDLAAKRLNKQDGYFTRLVMGKRELRDLAKQSTFMGQQIKDFIARYPNGNYQAQAFETELRGMGVAINVSDSKISGSSKYQVIVWHGTIDANDLMACGVEVDEDKRGDMVEAEVWMLDDKVIKAVMNPWSELGEDVRTLHYFLFDEDDTAPIGFGMPNIMRDTQMSVSAATRMMLDNASVVCGPILEMNTGLLRTDQDTSSVSAYKVYYRDDDGQTAAYPAIREIKVESHISDLENIIELFMKIGDIETFVGPMTGGDMSKMPSEPMRNLAGASMLMGNASLPFKQIIRNFDGMTRSIIQSLVQFNKMLNADRMPIADYDVIARGATSLIAKEVRGQQVDQLAATLKPEEALHVDMRKLVTARFRVRDLADMLVSPEEASRRQAAQDAVSQATQEMQKQNMEANTRNLLSQAFKNIAQGVKNQVGASAETVNTALMILEKGAGLSTGTLTGAMNDNNGQGSGAQTASPQSGGNAGGGDPGAAGQPTLPDLAGLLGGIAGAGGAQAGGLPVGGLPSATSAG